jgi:hypothetical protein
MWKNNAERDRPQMTIWRMRIACWITMAIDTRSGCVILKCFSTATTAARMCLNITFYPYCPSCSTYILMWFSHLGSGLPRGAFNSGFCTKTLCKFLYSLMLAKGPATFICTKYNYDIEFFICPINAPKLY